MCQQFKLAEINCNSPSQLFPGNFSPPVDSWVPKYLHQTDSTNIVVVQVGDQFLALLPLPSPQNLLLCFVFIAAKLFIFSSTIFYLFLQVMDILEASNSLLTQINYSGQLQAESLMTLYILFGMYISGAWGLLGCVKSISKQSMKTI